jgi:hypothetical protein
MASSKKSVMQLQISVCTEHAVAYFPIDETLKVGIAKNFRLGIQPLNGLRHSPTSETSGWYFWRGEELSTAIDFFEPLHTFHLADRAPQVLKYLGLPPGWRFLIADGYEDVWFDGSLITQPT